MFMAMLILQRCNYFTSISIARSFNDFNYSLWRIISRSSQSHMVYIIGVPKNLVQFIGKHLCWSVFFNKLQAWGMQLYQKRDCITGVFLWILWNFFRNTFFTEKSQGDCFCIFFFFFWSSIKKCFFISLSGYFERLCFFICWYLIHGVITAICFWQYIFIVRTGARFKVIFKTTCLLWVK